MKLVYAYIRVSTVKQGERGSSLVEQRRAIELYAEKQNLKIIQWFEEKETAAKYGRVQFTSMMSLLIKGKAEGVIIHKIDRGARNLRDWADIGGLIDKGIEVHFAHESLDMQSRGGRLAADIQAVVAADFIRNLRDEVRKGFQGRLRQGLYPLPAPVGYKDQGRAMPKLPDPLMAPLVQRAFHLYATGTYNLRTLGQEMYKAGLRNRRGGRVTKPGLSTMLNNEFYIGIIHIERTGERYPGIHTPLVSKSTFDRVQDVLEGRTKNRGLKYDFKYRKTLKCHHCEYNLTAERQKGIVYYRCQNRECPVTCVREDSVDAQMAENLYKATLTPDQLLLLRRDFENLDMDRSRHMNDLLASKRLMISNIDERLARLTDLYIDRGLDKDAFEARNKTLLHEKAEITEQLAKIQCEIDQKKKRTDDFLELAKSIYIATESGNDLERCDVLKQATSNFQINQKTLVVTWKSPFREVVLNKKSLIGAPYRTTSRTKKAKVSRFARRMYKLLHDQRPPNESGPTSLQ